ncbi:MAG: hypothetical protein EBQ76_02930 [Betaproteobacteria bacterium]|nr:hypothetical protein [Betaproteobacteria bacterium]NBY13702.1 hypothetical protein [Betaproteobacteria bacterium]NCA16278.1 hypothetical protein [Betaproteobacteria bacterium]
MNPVRQLLSKWGEPRPLPGLAASAAQTIPRTLLFALAALYAWSGLFGHDPWKGDDILGIALARSTFLSWLHSPQPGQLVLLPNLDGLIVARDGPLLSWLMALIAMPLEVLSQSVLGQTMPLARFDDVCRATLAISLIVGLLGLWKAVNRLAQRREARPVDPLGIGPSAPSFGKTLGDCAVLLALASLGGLARWHEAGPSSLSFALQAWLLWSVSFAPESPRRAARLSGLLLALLLLTDGPESALAWGAGIVLVCQLAQPWRLVRASFLGQGLLVFCTISAAAALLIASVDGRAALSIWWGQQTDSHLQSLVNLLRSWVWTWWPAWPIVITLGVQAVRHRLWHLPHLQMLFLLFGAVTLIGLTGLGASDASRLLPIAPLAALGAFGLLSLPRSVTNLLDWFAVVVFTSLGFFIWLYWSAMHAGFPANLAQRLKYFAPDLTLAAPTTSAFLLGVGVSGAWVALVIWRIRRSQGQLWRPVVLSAGGISLTWVLMMNLWGPALEVNRGYPYLVAGLSKSISETLRSRPRTSEQVCIATAPGDVVSRAIVLAHGLGPLQRIDVPTAAPCPLFLASIDAGLAASSPGEVLFSGSRLPSRPERERFALYWVEGAKRK